MPTEEHISGLVESFIVDELSAADRDELSPDKNLLTEGVLDSINVMRLIRHIETTLGVKIPPRDLIPKNFISIQAMAHYLTELTSSKQEPKRNQE